MNHMVPIHLPSGNHTDYILNKLKEQQKEINHLKQEIAARDNAILHLKKELSNERKQRISLQADLKNWNQRSALFPLTISKNSKNISNTPRKKDDSLIRNQSNQKISNDGTNKRTNKRNGNTNKGIGDYEVESFTESESTTSEVNDYVENVLEESKLLQEEELKHSPKIKRQEDNICRSPNYSALLNAFERSKVSKSPKESPRLSSPKTNPRKSTQSTTHSTHIESNGKKGNIVKKSTKDIEKMDNMQQKHKIDSSKRITKSPSKKNQELLEFKRASFKWTTIRDAHLEILKDGFSIQSTKSLGSALCKDFVFNPSQDTVRFGIKILDYPTAPGNNSYILIGVAQPEGFNISDDCCGMNKNSWSIDTCFGQRWNQGLFKHYYDSPINVGDIIDVIVHRGRISFAINNEPLGTAYRNINVPVCPCVTFLGKGYQVEVITEDSEYHQMIKHRLKNELEIQSENEEVKIEEIQNLNQNVKQIVKQDRILNKKLDQFDKKQENDILTHEDNVNIDNTEKYLKSPSQEENHLSKSNLDASSNENNKILKEKDKVYSAESVTTEFLTQRSKESDKQSDKQSDKNSDNGLDIQENIKKSEDLEDLLEINSNDSLEFDSNEF